jgi:hypothetical protein
MVISNRVGGRSSRIDMPTSAYSCPEPVQQGKVATRDMVYTLQSVRRRVSNDPRAGTRPDLKCFRGLPITSLVLQQLYRDFLENSWSLWLLLE